MAKREHSPFPLLKDEQADASHPQAKVWLSASAGTGKTQVLTARVLRLLLRGAAPESILCLTFTKAGAAEMAERIHDRLGQWVRLSGPELFRDLSNLGEAADEAALAYARTLFARVLDARGGGLRIQTIHSFCQSLLGSFPAEAGLIPGFRPIEGREETLLRQSTLAHLVSNAERNGQLGLIERLQALAARLGEDGARAFLGRCAAAPDAMEDLGLGIDARVRRWLGLGDIDPRAMLRDACEEGGYDRVGLETIRAHNLAWNTKTGIGNAEAITDWLMMRPEGRHTHIGDLVDIWTKKDGEPRVIQSGLAKFPDYAGLIDRQWALFNRLLQLCQLEETAAALSSALTLGQVYARAYADAKRAAGAVDFNDMIRTTVTLLREPGIGDWISYKLDQATDHVLIDEAQDTNADQWEIVRALAGEFFAGEGAKGKTNRTLFVVGDYKQAIFGFQGTDPQEFNQAREYFSAAAAQSKQKLLDLSLARSFRSGPPVLELVDATLDTLGHEALGLPRPDPAHISARGGSGSVTLLPPVAGAFADADDEDAEEEWLTDATLAFASDLAVRVKHWTTGGLTLRNQGDRPARPEDVLILLRSRGDMARLIVSRLYEAGVPVAGVDRLRLNAPIAVMDLLACIRFALQPLDDLNLATLMVSPLVGWSQDELYEHAKGRKGALWPHLRKILHEEMLSVPYTLLNMADLTTPHRFLETILSGPIRGRAKLIARLGEEARDPIEELLNAALTFERDAPPSLQLFLDWFDRGDVEIKRDPSKPESAVRVMTVHGAKGLQAPIVVLADATRDPDFKNPRDLNWIAEEGLSLPVFRPRKAELVGSLKDSAEASDAREREEHWRLLYVALTRAEEHLFIGGALGPRQVKNGMGEDCWHMRVGAALRSLGAVSDESGTLVHAREDKPLAAPKHAQEADALPTTLPHWLSTPAPEEARPPRPLAPSKLEADDTEASPPPDPAMRAAARRGIRLHALFERLPGVAPERRTEAAAHWLEHSEGVTDPAERVTLVADALAVIGHPDFAAIFSPDALAEAPLAGIVGERVISGTVDRLLVSDHDILIVDFKTGRRVPSGQAAVPEHHKAQMAAYAAVLAGIFPNHDVRAALLYTSGPRLIALDADTLKAHKPGYRDQQDKLPAAS
jgi:ATP-dependent helicase/nuclease subunit A